MTLKWTCFVIGCNFVTEKTNNGLVNPHRSLGLARHNHLKKHGINTADEYQTFAKFGKQRGYYKKDEFLQRRYNTDVKNIVEIPQVESRRNSCRKIWRNEKI